MYRLLIVDDEPVIVNGLIQLPQTRQPRKKPRAQTHRPSRLANTLKR
ncbi:hypothetical protein [Paenibacillus sp. AR247]|nr:hypothetical protein [Paenibacillus sp. AR247]